MHAACCRPIFGNGGRVAISHGVIPPAGDRSLAASVKGPGTGTGTGTRIRSIEVWELKSVWP